MDIVNRTRGYFAIGIYRPKWEVNVGSLWRSAFCFGANLLFTIGERYQRQCSDTTRSWKHVPLIHFTSIEDCIEHLPKSCPLVGVELVKDAYMLSNYQHLERAAYLLGSEDTGLPKKILEKCNHKVMIPYAVPCLNVSCAGSIIMYDRINKIATK